VRRGALIAVVLAVALNAAAPAVAGSVQGKHKGVKHHHHQKGGVEIPIEEPATPEDLSFGWLFIALGIAALIGVAGGVIMTNLLGGDPGAPSP
jgi:hypothetical protein